MKTLFTLAFLSAFGGASMVAAQNAPPAEPTAQPDWTEVRNKTEAHIRASYLDPSAAQIIWIRGFTWGRIKPALMKSTWGWIACADINGKNQYGGYVGARGHWVIYTPDAKVGFGELSIGGSLADVTSPCDKPGNAPLQSALIDQPIQRRSGVADEIGKLAALLDKGLITRGEFDVQKARLLQQ